MDFSSWCRSNNYDESQLTPAMRRHLEAAYRAEVGAEQIPFAETVALEDAPGEYRAVLDQYVQSNEHCLDKQRALRELSARLLSEGASLKDFKLALLREDRTVRGMQTTLRPQADVGADVITAGLMLSHGNSERAVAHLFGDRVTDMATERGMRTMTFHGVCRQVLAAHGERPNHGRLTEENIRHALRLSHRGEMMNVGPSGLSISGILSNYANKSMLMGFESPATTWQRFCKIGNASDFKTQRMYRLTGSGQLDPLAPGGQIQHGSLTEATFTNEIATKAKLLAMDRRDMVNDDMGALDSVPKILGRMCTLAVERVVYTTFLDDAAFFPVDSSLLNYDAGADTVLALTGLGLANALYTGQVDANGDPLLLPAGILLVPSILEPAGRSLVTAGNIVDGTSTAAQVDNNPWAGKFELVATPYLGTAIGLAGSSQTGWYIVCPAEFAGGDYCVMVVHFLDGRTTPVIESSDLDFDRLGMAWRTYFDFGASFLEPKGGVKMKGAV